MKEIFAENLPPADHEAVVRSYSESIRNLTDENLKQQIVKYMVAPHVADFIASLINNPQRCIAAAFHLLDQERGVRKGLYPLPLLEVGIESWINEHEMIVVARMIAEEIFNNQIYPRIVWDSQSILVQPESEWSAEFYYQAEFCMTRIQKILSDEFAVSFEKIFYTAISRSKVRNMMKG